MSSTRQHNSRKRSWSDSSDPEGQLQYPKFFMRNVKGQWRCTICGEDRGYEPLSKARRHEESQMHVRRLRDLDRPRTEHFSDDFDESEDELDHPTTNANTMKQSSGATYRASYLYPTSNHAMSNSESVEHFAGTIHGPALSEDAPEQLYDDWGGELAEWAIEPQIGLEGDRVEDVVDEEEELWTIPFETEAQGDSSDTEASRTLGQRRSKHASFERESSPAADVDNHLLSSPTRAWDRDEAGPDEEDEFAPEELDFEDHDNDPWWPWPNRKTCLLDTTGAFPRSLFSESEMNAVRWYASKNGAQRLPTIRQVKLARERVLNVAGVDPRTHSGQCGHLYTTTDLNKLIAHEFANPVTRARLHLYAEDAGNVLREARHGRRWGVEVDPNLAGPMARSATGKDYYVHEIALANIDEHGTIAPVVIARWFQRGGNLIAKAHPLRTTADRAQFVVDARSSENLEVPLTSFLLNVEDLSSAQVQAKWGLPPPDKVQGVLSSDLPSAPLGEWCHPPRNPWRTRARGRPAYGLPIWLYCDDTSGNISKKWNKHNSVLFVLGGLPYECTTQLHNVHFLSTSNIASPLEMMEHISEALREAREEGIDVWDCESGEDALVIPWVLAFQGDNPMASEFASHIGMCGKCACRVCEAFVDRQQDLETLRNASTSTSRAPTDSNATPPGAHPAPNENATSKHLTDRKWLSEFMTAGKPRSKAQTLADLKAQETRAFGGAPSAVDGMATDTGTKDKYFLYFLDKLQRALNEWREDHKNTGTNGSSVPGAAPSTRSELQQSFLRKLRQEMPDNLFNPVLNIPDFDANSDSPLEVLHVVLLGVVKYWWRDAVSRQNSEGKEELKTRLDSLDTSGLAMASSPRGQTLVYYAKSLVGRDFRVVLQVAPAVLHGMIPEPAYEAWLALCRLAPLVYQDKIGDLQDYTKRLESAVFDFLAATALWTTQWFNKPKFHLFVHLLEHIRRFGPAPIYATETFESYNLVIRLRSVNSNKHAPSLDIARAFSHLHAVRHLVCGGWVSFDQEGRQITPRQAGQGVRDLFKDPVLCQLMCLSDADGNHKPGTVSCPDTDDQLAETSVICCLGHYIPVKSEKTCAYSKTQTYKENLNLRLPPTLTRCRSVILLNKDRVDLGKYVLYRQEVSRDMHEPSASTHVGRVEEILVDPEYRRICGILITRCEVGQAVMPYRMPSCRAKEGDRTFVVFEELLATVNTIHNCVKHQCMPTRTRVVYQERYETNERADEITHQTHPEDRILNLAQLRSMEALHRFRVAAQYPGLSLDNVLDQAISVRTALDEEVQRKKDEAQRKKDEAKRKREETQRKKAESQRRYSEAPGQAPSRRAQNKQRNVPGPSASVGRPMESPASQGISQIQGRGGHNAWQARTAVERTRHPSGAQYSPPTLSGMVPYPYPSAQAAPHPLHLPAYNPHIPATSYQPTMFNSQPREPAHQEGGAQRDMAASYPSAMADSAYLNAWAHYSSSSGGGQQ
ncbi:hypothetical protein C2E23DRAFT_780036 [Lenzites betulinus]|nr:hypothetical protein C2E23DRAFT_780036 [Lenzites betulinus]